MRQVLQSLKTGDIEIVDAPCPAVRPGHVLIRSRASLISAGTERMLVEFGQAGLIEKARRQPERIREVLDKARADGLAAAWESVRSKLNERLPLGYCNVGRVLEGGAGVTHVRPGDRVVSNGPHAEMVQVPKLLCAKIPDEVDDEQAAFAVAAAVGLQGMRLAEPTLGECFVVTGLGLIGLLTVQLLRAGGCRVLGVDLDQRRLQVARELGAETVAAGSGVVEAARRFSRGRGVDGVLIAASCDSDEPVRQAAEMCRKRGRLVLVGTAGLRLRRSDFYEKELSFRVSCSYGPGRYDPQYEQQGADYPVGFVRWTEQRNFEAVLDMMADGRLSAAPLISHRFAFADAAEAYRLITSSAPSLGVILRHAAPQRGADAELRSATRQLEAPAAAATRGDCRASAAVVGAGNFAKRTLIPGLRAAGAEIVCVASQSGMSALLAARDERARSATSDWQAAVRRQDVDLVAVATRHDSHAEIAAAALAAGKHVYLEKPLALNPAQLQRVVAGCHAARRKGGNPLLMVGFNRRFAPAIRRIHAAVGELDAPKSLVLTVNAGHLPQDHWCHDPRTGGGRVIGEACHFIDLLRHLCGHPVTRVQATTLSNTPLPADKVCFLLSFADGSSGAVHYLANGHRSFPKERLEVFCDGRILQLDNYRRLRSFGWSGVRSRRYWRQDKGHRAAIAAFLAAVTEGGPSPIPLTELIETTEVSWDVVRAAETGETVRREQRLIEPSRRSA